MKSSVPCAPISFNVTVYSVEKEFYISVLMTVGPCNSRNAAIITIIAAIVVTAVSMADQKSHCPSRSGCSQPKNPSWSVSFVLTGNSRHVYEISSNCFPFNTTLLYVCKAQNTQQFRPASTGNLLSRRCTGKGWLDENDNENPPPACVNRKKHCFLPPIVPNFFVQIDNLNVSGHSNGNPERSYSEGTIATYKCINPQLPEVKEVQQTWRCTKAQEKIKKWSWSPFATSDSWEWTKLTAQDSPCDIPKSRNDSITATKTTAISYNSIATKTTAVTNTKPSKYRDNDVVDIDLVYQQQAATQRNIIIGICGFVALVLIVTLLGVCYYNRLMFGKRYGDGLRHRSQPSPALMAEEQSKCNESDGQDLLYANIIPIKVNSETIYAEVQTGRIKSNGKQVKYTISDDQIQTIYAEIHHPK